MTQMNKKQKGTRVNKPSSGMVVGSQQEIDQIRRNGEILVKVN